MPNDLRTIDDLSNRILRLLFDGWNTADDVKSGGTLTAAAIAARLNEPEPVVREHLLFLETLGYLLTQRLGAGGDPTIEQRGVDEGAGSSDHARDDLRYSISESGRQNVAASLTSDGRDDDQQHSGARG